MKYEAKSVEAYIGMLPSDRQASFQHLRNTLKAKFPHGFEESMAYGMPAYVLSHKSYPPAYHCNPKETLPLISPANQKNFIALCHMGIHALTELSHCIQSEYHALCCKKSEHGKKLYSFQEN